MKPTNAPEPDTCVKEDYKDISINCTREELMREIHKLDIQIQKIKLLIEGED